MNEGPDESPAQREKNSDRVKVLLPPLQQEGGYNLLFFLLCVCLCAGLCSRHLGCITLIHKSLCLVVPGVVMMWHL